MSTVKYFIFLLFKLKNLFTFHFSILNRILEIIFLCFNKLFLELLHILDMRHIRKYYTLKMSKEHQHILIKTSEFFEDGLWRDLTLSSYLCKKTL